MKTSSFKILFSLAAAIGVSASANADLLYTFDSAIPGGWGGTYAWSAGPAGWAGAGSLKSINTTGGWQDWHQTYNAPWSDGALSPQPTLTAMAAAGNAALSFDIVVDGTSFAPGVSDWYNLTFAANSDSGAWTQFENILGASAPWHDSGDSAMHVTHLNYTFAQLGWSKPLTSATWFQLNFAANSGASPIDYYIDNVNFYTVPEPTTLTLLGLGAAALLMFRRK